MPTVAAVSTVELPNRTSQQAVREFARKLFAPAFPDIDRLLGVFDHAGIERRNLCKPLDWYMQPHTFEEQNNEYIRLALDYAVEAAEKCLAAAGVPKEAVTDLVFVSTTGLATPSLDALVIDRMRLSPYTRRMALFGPGCAGGVSGVAKACALAAADPEAVVLLVAVELCSLTFLRSDPGKSNFVGSCLFADGAAACLVTGDASRRAGPHGARFVAAGSRLYYDTQEVMGWDFTDRGFKVRFSPGIPALVRAHVRDDVTAFLARHGRALSDLDHCIFHPGGRKVLAAYEEALELAPDALQTTRGVLRDYGNMSSTTVLYVLERFLDRRAAGCGLMMAMGPGFSSEMLLLDLNP
ncbi:type III polyketide synthase [Alistipes sp.]|uniref:type III polyketide synthase n=1 Tax=Alistipes sp. TaxID=1872444 RepID=UPI003AF00CEF